MQTSSPIIPRMYGFSLNEYRHDRHETLPTPSSSGWWLSHLPLWKMMEFVSWDYDIPNCFWKVNPNSMVPVTTNQSSFQVSRNIETTQPVTKKTLPRCHHPSVMDFPPSLQITAFTTSPSRSLWLLIQLGLRKTPISASGTSGFSTLRRSSWGDGPNAVEKRCWKVWKVWKMLDLWFLNQFINHKRWKNPWISPFSHEQTQKFMGSTWNPLAEDLWPTVSGIHGRLSCGVHSSNPIEIDGLPINSMVDLSMAVSNKQMVYVSTVSICICIYKCM